MPKLVLLWTDVAMWLMAAALAGYVLLVLRRPGLRANWTKVFGDARGAGVVGGAGTVPGHHAAGQRALPAAAAAGGRQRGVRAGLRHAHAFAAGRAAGASGRFARGHLFASAVLRGLHQGVGRSGRAGPAHRPAPEVRRRAPAGPGFAMAGRSGLAQSGRAGAGRAGRNAAVGRAAGAGGPTRPPALGPGHGRGLARRRPDPLARGLHDAGGHRPAGRTGGPAGRPLPRVRHRPDRQRRALPGAEEHPHRLRHRHAGDRGHAAAGGGPGHRGRLLPWLGRTS